jgi:hypothetical protein
MDDGSNLFLVVLERLDCFEESRVVLYMIILFFLCFFNGQLALLGEDFRCVIHDLFVHIDN